MKDVFFCFGAFYLTVAVVSRNICNLICICLAQGHGQDCQKCIQFKSALLRLLQHTSFVKLLVFTHPETCCFLRPKFTFAGGMVRNIEGTQGKGLFSL